MTFSVLASSSSGNAVFVRSGGFRLLLDAGLPLRHLEERLNAIGESASQLDAVLITHEHPDHSCGVGPLDKYSVPVHVQNGCRVLGNPRTRRYRHAPGAAFEVGPFEVRSVLVAHDAPDTVAYILRLGGQDMLAYAVDLGYPSEILIEELSHCSIVILEANHDLDMLYQCETLPTNVLDRIDSNHLANDQAAYICRQLPDARGILLAHLSTTNNQPGLALETVRGSCLTELAVASPALGAVTLS